MSDLTTTGDVVSEDQQNEENKENEENKNAPDGPQEEQRDDRDAESDAAKASANQEMDRQEMAEPGQQEDQLTNQPVGGENAVTGQTVPESVKAFLDAVNAIVAPNELTPATAAALNDQLLVVYDAYDELSQEDQAREDVAAALAQADQIAALLSGNNGIMLLDETEDENSYTVQVTGTDGTMTTYDSMADALAAAAAGDTVTLGADIEVGSTLTIGQAITLDLNHHQMTGDGSCRVLRIAIQQAAAEDTLTIKNGTIIGGNAVPTNGNGGAIWIQDARTADKENIAVRLESLTLTGNTANKGGAVAVNQGQVTISNCTMTGNQAAHKSSGYGGAIYADDANKSGVYASLMIDSSTISGNTATKHGGAIYTTVDTTIADSTIGTSDSDVALAGNTSTGASGGGIYYASSNTHPSTTLTLRGDTTVSGNTASTGGGIASGSSSYLYSGKVTGYTSTVVLEDGTVITGNTGRTHGGGVYLVGNGTRFQMNGGSITDNETNGSGGGIYSSNWRGITVAGGSIEGNKATEGGAIYIENTNITNNPIDQEILQVGNGVSVQNNRATRSGGGIYMKGGVSATIADGAALYNNVAGSESSGQGDDVYAASGNRLTLCEIGSDWRLTSRGENREITDWYYDAEGARWIAGTYRIYSIVSDDAGALALKAAGYEMTTLPADLLIDRNDTEHDAVPDTARGSSHSLIGQVQVASIRDQMNAVGEKFGADENGRLYGQDIWLSDVDFYYVATLTAPEGVTLPDDLSGATVNIAGFEVDAEKSNIVGKVATVYFRADSENTATYGALRQLVNDAADTNDGWLSITIPGVTIDNDAALGHHTFVGTVDGRFSATATLGMSTQNEVSVISDGADTAEAFVMPPISHRFAYGWNTTQWPDGRDAVADEDDAAIQLTVNVTAPSSPGNNDGSNDRGSRGSGSSGGSSATTAVQTIEEAGSVETPVQEIVEYGDMDTPIEIQESGHIGATGDDSRMMIYGRAIALAVAFLTLWYAGLRKRNG